jgi:hypothetical protein
MQNRPTLLASLALLLLAAPLPAGGATFLVNVKSDVPDATPGNGICDVDLAQVGDQCSLRAAVQTANEDPDADIINLENGTYVLSLSGVDDDAERGDLDVTSPMSIASNQTQGSPDVCFIDGKRLKDRIFDVKPGGNLDLRRVSLLNGKTAKGDVDPGFPGELSGGCIRSEGILTLGRVFFYRCASSDDGGCLGVLGGTADIGNSIFSTCKAKAEGGGLVLRAGTASLRNVTAGANRAETGGAFAVRGTLTLANGTIDGNRAKLAAGGIAVLGAGSATINSTTISSNRRINLSEDTTGAVTLSNTIVWGAETDCTGTIVSAGGNLEGAVSCAFGGTNDQQSRDPLLAPLNLYGGLVPTRTLAGPDFDDLAEEPGSPAIDHGLDGATCENPDARQVARVDVPGLPVGGGGATCDVGAVEFDFQPPPP